MTQEHLKNAYVHSANAFSHASSYVAEGLKVASVIREALPVYAYCAGSIMLAAAAYTVASYVAPSLFANYALFSVGKVVADASAYCLYNAPVTSFAFFGTLWCDLHNSENTKYMANEFVHASKETFNATKEISLGLHEMIIGQEEEYQAVSTVSDYEHIFDDTLSTGQYY